MESSSSQAPNNSSTNNKENKGVSSFMCRQSSSRWTPTSEQIRILKDLYYNTGIRSPSADQIQRISARLRQYGKIEGKNVFYWFQNHKARERQKKRFTNVTTTTNAAQYDHLHISGSFQRPNHSNNNNNNINALNPAHWRSSDYLQADHLHTTSFNHLYANNYPPPNANSAGVFAAVGHMGSYAYGSVAMEQSFRECSISPKNDKNCGGSAGQDISVPRVYPFLGKINSVDDEQETLEDDQDDDIDDHNNNYDDDDYDDEAYREIETLPLFPMRGEEYSSSFTCNNHMINKPESSHGHYYPTNAWYHSDLNASARASLELSLNSCITTTASTHRHFY